MDKTARAHVKHAAETALRCLSQGVPVEALYGLLQLTRDYPGHVCVIKQSFLSCLAAFLDSINCGDSEADLQRFSRVARDVCEVYCHDDAALTMLGVKCLDEGLVRQAQFFLEAALRVDPDCLGAKENLRALYDRMVVRWHFLMLNDFSRNMAYATAIERAVASRPDCYVLDIGSGTGILRCAINFQKKKKTTVCSISFLHATFPWIGETGGGGGGGVFHCPSMVCTTWNFYLGLCPAKSPFWIVFQVFNFFHSP